eukprot:436806-Amphidinium_carterae.5
MGVCSQAVGATSRSELQSASHGGVAAACMAAGIASCDGFWEAGMGAHRTCGGGRAISEAASQLHECWPEQWAEGVPDAGHYVETAAVVARPAGAV